MRSLSRVPRFGGPSASGLIASDDLSDALARDPEHGADLGERHPGLVSVPDGLAELLPGPCEIALRSLELRSLSLHVSQLVSHAAPFAVEHEPPA